VIDSRKRRPKDTVASANPADSPSSSLFEESTAKRKSKVSRTGRLTLPQLHELERKKEVEVKRGFKLLCEFWPRMLLPRGDDGQELAEREWLLEAEKLVDMFRETRNLFRTSRVSFLTPLRFSVSERAAPPLSRATRSEACYQRGRNNQQKLRKKMKMKWHLVSTWTLVSANLRQVFRHARPTKPIERVRLSHDRANESSKAGAIDNFRSVTFDNWLRLFMQVRISPVYLRCRNSTNSQYAFLLTKRGKYELADEVLNHVLISNAFMDRQSQDTIHLALIGA